MSLKFYKHKCLFVLTLLFTQILYGQNCVEFSNLPSATYAVNNGYPFGTPFHTESGASLGLAPFHYNDGSVRNNVSTSAGTFFWSGAFVDGQGQVIRLLESSVDIDFTENFAVADNVSFAFLDWDGDINLSINGEPVMNARSFNELPSQIATYVTMTVNDSPAGSDGRKGTVSFSGPIYSMTIGGFELGIDNICFTQGSEPGCTITHVLVEQLACDESTGNFNLAVDYNGLNTSNSFEVTVGNNTFGPFSGSQAPFTVGPFPGDGSAYLVEVTDSNNPGCSNAFQLAPITCEQNTACDISNITAVAIDCAGDYLFDAVIDFDRNSSPSELFEVNVNGASYGSYHYNSFPITLTLPGNGPFNNNVNICDLSDNTCCLGTTFTGFECAPPCMISEVITEVSECDNGTFNILVDVEGSGLSSDLYVTLNDEDYGNAIFPTSSFPIIVGPLAGDGTTSYRIDVYDTNNFQTCNNGATVAPVLCEVTEPCNISNLNVQSTGCVGTNEYEVFIEFDRTSSPSDQFIITIDGITMGTFPAAGFPISLIHQSNGSPSSILSLADASDPSCILETSFLTLDCPPACSISNLSVTTTQCTAINRYGAIIDFNRTSSPSDQFIVQIDGMTIGSYPANSFPLTLNNLQSNGVQNSVLTILDASDASCSLETNFQRLDCRPACSIDEFVATPMACNSNDLFMIQVDLSGTTLDNPISISVNGTNVGQYDPAQFPIMVGPYLGDGNTVYQVTGTDTQLPNCSNGMSFTAPQCEPIIVCEITNLMVSSGECTGDNLQSIIVDFDYTSVNSGNFMLFLGDNLLGQYNYSALPLALDNIPTSGIGTETVTIFDSQISDCEASTTFQTLNCTVVPDCSISNLDVSVQECTGEDTYSLILDFSYANTGNTFTINIGNTQIGPISYSSLPLTINNVTNSGNLFQSLFVCDNDNADCCLETGYEEPDCSVSLCNISSVTSERSNCDEGMFMVMLDAAFINPGDEGFQISANGETYGNFAYTDLPVMLGPFEGDGTRVYEFVMTDMEDGECSNSTIVEAYDCTEECVMGDIQVEVGDCQSNGMIPVTFYFESNNNSGTYTVSQNNTVINTMGYADGPATIMLDGTSLVPYNMTFSDTGAESCSSSIPVGPFGCIATSNRDTEIENVEVYVSDATQQLNIQVPVSTEITLINIYNINGQRIMQDNLGAGVPNLQMDISNLNSNIYVVEIIQNNKRAVRKFHRIK